MKSILKVGAILAVVATLAVATMGTALAQTSTPPEFRGFKGAIASVSPNGTSLVLTTKAHGDVTIQLTAQTKYKAPGLPNATLAVFEAGKRAAFLVDANGVALHAYLIPGPLHVQRGGTVTVGGYVAGTSITLASKQGDLSTFVITGVTQVQFKQGTTAVNDGSHVLVIAQRDPATDRLTAKAILVFAGSPKGPPDGAGGPPPPPGKGPG